MKLKCLMLIFSMFIFVQKSYCFNIILDPGHGGHDSGALNYKIKESSIVLNIAKKIESKLKDIVHSNQKLETETENAPTIKLTRSSDRFVSLEDRIQFAKKSTPDLFVSLHANSSTSKSVQGMEVYFPVDKTDSITSDIVADIKNDLIKTGKNTYSQLLALEIQNQWSLTTSIVRRAPFYVLQNNTIPSVLIEVGFVTHKIESKKLINETYQNTIAETITTAINNYKNKYQQFSDNNSANQ